MASAGLTGGHRRLWRPRAAPSGQRGYAMLAALLVAAVAGLAALLAVGAAGAVHEVARDDAAAWRADAAAQAAVDAAAASLRWRPGLAAASGEGSATPVTAAAGGPAVPAAWSWSWRREAPADATAWPRALAAVKAQAGPARREATVALEVRAEPWVAGVHVAGDVEVAAPLRLSGCGLLTGGCLRGRERLSWEGGEAADLVHGDLWPVAAVHARGTIWAGGREIHDGDGACPWPDDGDDCGGGAPPAALLRLPGRAWLAAARAHAVAPGDALRDGVVDLAALAAALPAGATAAGGACVVVASQGRPLLLGGDWPETAPPLLLVVDGDAAVAGAAPGCRLRGALVVLGHLDVAAPLVVAGGLAAGDLRIAAATQVVVLPGWRARPLPGAWRPVVVGWQE